VRPAVPPHHPPCHTTGRPQLACLILRLSDQARKPTRYNGGSQPGAREHHGALINCWSSSRHFMSMIADEKWNYCNACLKYKLGHTLSDPLRVPVVHVFRRTLTCAPISLLWWQLMDFAWGQLLRIAHPDIINASQSAEVQRWPWFWFECLLNLWFITHTEWLQRARGR
jgi:hypothetical protein